MAYQKRNVDGKVGLCHQRAGAGPDGYDMRRSSICCYPDPQGPSWVTRTGLLTVNAQPYWTTGGESCAGYCRVERNFVSPCLEGAPRHRLELRDSWVLGCWKPAEPAERAKRKGLGRLRCRICNPSARSAPSGARYSTPEITARAEAAAKATNAAPKNSSILYSRKIVPAQNKAKQINSATFLVRVSFQTTSDTGRTGL